MKYLLILFAALFILSCRKTSQAIPGISACTQSLIDSALSKPRGTLFVSVVEYLYNGTTVYLYYAGCCDGVNDLRDENCKYLFTPSGGIVGCGDCTHKNFFNEAHFIKTVWIDPRP
jgi:hypothetical protein